MAGRLRLVHCVNQFFGGLGGEEAAGREPVWFDGARGPGRLLETLDPRVEVVGTLVFGDDWVARDAEGAAERIAALVAARVAEAGRPCVDLIVAGPAFRAGRYGLACGAVCRALAARLGVQAVTAMHPDNPGVQEHRRHVAIVRTGADVGSMREAAAGLLAVGRKLVRGEAISPETDGTIARGLRRNHLARASGAARALDMLLAKLRGEPFASEYPMPMFDRVAPAPPLADAASAVIALVTSGGIVPRGNPDRIEAASASRFGAYSLAGLDALSPATHQTIHGGYDPTFANADPNRVLPLDASRELERQGRIGRLHERYYATVGNATEVAAARRFGREIAARLVADGVQAVILTST
jgi:glycine reductase